MVSDAGGIPPTGSGFGIRLNAPGFRAGNRVAGGVEAGRVASSDAGFVSGFAAAPSEKPLKFSVGIEDVTGTAGAVAEEEDEVSLTATPFPINNGGVFGLVNTDDVALSTKGATRGSGGVGLTSAGDGDDSIPPPSHWPNGGFGDAW